MDTIRSCALAIAVGACAWPGNAEAKPEAKEVFVEQKCTLCHSALSAGIKAPTPSKNTIDVSGLAAKGRTATWLLGYLKKTETLEGKAHPPKFRGTPAELDVLVEWLMSLKPAP